MYLLMKSTLLPISRFLGNKVEISVMSTDWWKPLVSWWRFTEIHFLTEIYISHIGILAHSIPFSHLYCGRHKGHLWQTKWQQTTISIISYCCGLPESTFSFFFYLIPYSDAICYVGSIVHLSPSMSTTSKLLLLISYREGKQINTTITIMCKVNIRYRK